MTARAAPWSCSAAGAVLWPCMAAGAVLLPSKATGAVMWSCSAAGAAGCPLALQCCWSCLSVLCPKSRQLLGLQRDDDALLHGMREEARRGVVAEFHVNVGLLQQLDGVGVAGMVAVCQVTYQVRQLLLDGRREGVEGPPE